MGIYFVIIILCFTGEILKHSASNITKRISDILFLLVLLYLGLLIGFRSLEVGADTNIYAYLFKSYSKLPLKYIFEKNPFNLEVGFSFVLWFFSHISTEPSILFLSVSLFQVSAIGYWIKKESEDCFTSLIIYICMFFTFFLTGLRQSIALVVVLISEIKLKEGKTFPFLLGVFVACLFHMSSIISLAYLAVKKIKKYDTYFLFCLFGLFAAYLLRKGIFTGIVNLLSDSKYGDYTILNHGAPVTYTFMLITLSLAGVIYSRNNVFGEHERFTLCEMITAIPIMALVSVNGAIMRVAMYFSIFMVIYLPHFYNDVLKKSGILPYLFVKYVSLVILIILFNNNISSSQLYQYSFIGWDHVINIFQKN